MHERETPQEINDAFSDLEPRLKGKMIGFPLQTQNFIWDYICFLEDSGRGIFSKPPTYKGSDEQWRVNAAVLSTYLFDGKSYDDIGSSIGKFGVVYKESISKARVGQIIRATFGHIWNNASDAIKADYPYNSLVVVRNISIYHAMITLNDVHRLMEEDPAITRDKINSDLKLSPTRLTEIAVILGKNGHIYGIDQEVPFVGRYEDYGVISTLIEEAKHFQDDSKMQDALNRVTRGFMNSESGRSLLLSVREANSEYPYYKNDRTIEFIDALKAASIPFGIIETKNKYMGKKIVQRYYFIATSDLVRAQETFRNAPDLQQYKNPKIYQVCGDGQEPPSYSQFLKNQQNYAYLGNVTADLLDIEDISLEESIAQFFRINGEECPVAVFSNGKSYFVRLEDNDAIADFIREKKLYRQQK